MFVTRECACKPGEQFPDGNHPSFYTDSVKAEYMYRKLKAKARADHARISLGSAGDLSLFDIYFAVHLNGEHIISIK